MRRQHSPTAEQHERAVAAAAAAEKARVARLAAMDPEDRERRLRLAAYGIDPEPPTLLQMINDYLQLVNIGGRCYVEVYAERARRRIAARQAAAEEAARTGVPIPRKNGKLYAAPLEAARRAELEEVSEAPGEV